MLIDIPAADAAAGTGRGCGAYCYIAASSTAGARHLHILAAESARI